MKQVLIAMMLAGCLFFSFSENLHADSVTEAWTARHDGPPNQKDEGLAIMFDDAGYIYIMGQITGPGESINRNFAIIKYDSSGSELWSSYYEGRNSPSESYADDMVVPL